MAEGRGTQTPNFLNWTRNTGYTGKPGPWILMESYPETIKNPKHRDPEPQWNSNGTLEKPEIRNFLQELRGSKLHGLLVGLNWAAHSSKQDSVPWKARILFTKKIRTPLISCDIMTLKGGWKMNLAQILIKLETLSLSMILRIFLILWRFWGLVILIKKNSYK